MQRTLKSISAIHIRSLTPFTMKKRVGFNLKIFVFALMKTVHCRAERNPGRIGRLFNCNDRCFFIWREAPKPKCLPGLVRPFKVRFQRWPKKGSHSTWKFLFLRSWKLSKTGLSGILDVFCEYLTAMTGVFCYCERRPSPNFYLKMFVFALLKTVQNQAERNSGRILRLFNCNDRCFFIWREAPKPKCLPGLVSPIKVCFQRWLKKGSDWTWKFLCLRSWKLSKTGWSGIFDVFCGYLTAMTGVFSYGGRRPSQNVYLV